MCIRDRRSRRIIHGSQDEFIFTLVKPCRRDRNRLFVRRGLRHECSFPIARVEVELGMEVKISGMAVDVELQKRKARRLVQHGDPEIVNTEGCVFQGELYGEWMQTPTRHAIGWSWLKAVPIFVVALADDKNRIAVGIGIIDAVAAEFAGGVIKATDLPNRMICRECEAVDCRKRNRKQEQPGPHSPEKSLRRVRHTHHFGWIVIVPGRLGSSVQEPISCRLESS